ncbi:uncharacterized protein ACA1_097480 [Acanthamoeba castellanii str. Neff]|uniref:SREBP regulating gene protein n=1 Tax=Acanthamoeba castellanii (strain ATCC 30010 / Neff) TaxID=1257118 RepID=L8GK20_ACACF|nr:uncharacterized protein ACA1_097480 [Acanthamoeba castellanii str. Neff]ELR13063.1 hypothetical protein ACA1_097480 [Acanthamoeba castellanii str. Neff]
MELAGETQGGQDFVINLQPRFYGFYDNVAQFESSYTEEQSEAAEEPATASAVTVSVVVMIIVYSIIATSRDYYGGVPHRRNWWWSFFRRKLSESDKRPHEETGGGSQRAIAQKHEPAGGGEDDAGLGKTWLRTCDNSKQGRTYVTDERGYVCRWDQMYSGAGYGCCWESDRTNISRYSCQQCDIKTTCCLEYEFCVSCCLNPSQEQRVASWLQLNIEDSREREEMAPLSLFEQCLALCRTSSASILRQHIFISPSHFCYAGVPS